MVVVHGLWSRQGALCLWIDHEGAPAVGGSLDAEPRQAALHPSARPLDVESSTRLRRAAPGLAAALATRTRSTVELELPSAGGFPLASGTPDGVDDCPAEVGATMRRWRVPVVALNPDRAQSVLAEVSATTHDVPGITLGDDLRFLADVATCVGDRVAAGAVVPTLVEEEGTWWGRWLPLPDAAWERWRTHAVAAMPAVLLAEARAPAQTSGGTRTRTDVLDTFCAELTDLQVGRLAPQAAPDPAGVPGADTSAPGPVGAWIDALLAGSPVPGSHADLAALATRVRRWHASATTAPVELLLRITEPPVFEPDALQVRPDGEPCGTGWTVQVRLRSLDDPSLVLTPEEVAAGAGGLAWSLPQDPWSFALTELGRAAAVYPPLLAAQQAPGSARSSPSAGPAGSDLDTPLALDTVLDLVATGVPALVEAGIAVQLPGRWMRPAMSFTLHAQADAASLEGRAVSPDVGAPGHVGKDALVAYSWRLALGGEELSDQELAELVAAKSALVRLRGEWVEVDAERIARSLRFLEREGSGRASLGGVFARIVAAPPPEPVGDVAATGWLGDVLSGRAERTVTPVSAPSSLNAALRPYQGRGLSWLSFMARLGLGAVLADDMGLGKTLQLLALVLLEREEASGESLGGPSSPGPTLLVCPMSVVGNWQREAARFAPDLRVHVHHGPQRRHHDDLVAAVASSDLVLTTYATLTRDAAELAALAWGRVALDEAQHVKNSGTRAARAVRAVAGAPSPPGGTHRIALTGTPVENRLAELHAILDFTNPGLLGSPAAFRERFAVPVERHRDPGATALLTTLTRPFVLRRVKTDKDVIADLPEKLEMVVRANLTAEQASLYQAVVDDMLERLADAGDSARRGLVLATLTRLKQVCNHPAQYLSDGSPLCRRGRHRSGKLALVDDILDTVVADGERALCFTQYREFGELVAPYLAQRYSTDVPFLHGGVSQHARDAMVERFSGADGPPVMLLSLKAGGTGLNLTAANHVVHLDRWWNPAVEDQASDRAYRIGQTRQVQVRKLVCVGTVEERIDALMATKKDLADVVVASGEGWLGDLSTQALRDLFALGADAVGD